MKSNELVPATRGHAGGTYPATGHALTFRGDGWFNMTQAAQAFGKRLNNFWHAAGTEAYLGELARSLNLRHLDLYKTARGNKHTAEIGTWAHPKLAVYFARWLDVKFSVWCDMQIDELIRGYKTDPFKGPSAPMSRN